jgi:hypothetical protein
MAYGSLKFIYNTLVTSHTMITASSQADGRKGSASKSGTGTASIAVSGIFQGAFDLTLTIQIDSVTAGTNIGQATFKWRTSNTAAGAWEETGVTTSTTPYALSADGLGTNQSVAWSYVSGVAFAINDSWQVDLRATYGTERLLDRNRMTVWRATGDTSENIVINLGSAKAITAFVLQDHNLTSGATVTLQAHTSDSWGAPSYTSGALTVQDPIYFYPSETYQYWRILLADAANPDGYIDAANLFLGTSTSLASKINASWGSSRQAGYTLQSNISEPGVLRRYAYAKQKKLTLKFGKTVKNADIAIFLAMQEALINTATHRVLPLWIHNFSDEANTLALMDWLDIESWSYTFFQYLLNSGVGLQLDEVVKV